MNKSKPRMVVSGYPRSGNTFLRTVIKLSYTDVSVPLHIHNAAYVKENYKNECFVIPIRHPADAIASWDFYRDNDTIKNSILPSYKKDSGFFYYIDFYQKINSISDKVLLLDFNYLTKDIEYIYESVASTFSHMPTNKVSIEEVKRYMLEHNLNKNLKRDNTKSLSEYKEKVLAHPDYNKTLQIYNLILNKGRNENNIH